MSMSSSLKKILKSPLITYSSIAVVLILLAALFINDRTSRHNQLQERVNNLEVEVNGSSRTLTKSEFLSLQKDIAALKKESFAFQDSTYITLVQIATGLTVFSGFFLTWRSQNAEKEKNKQDYEAAMASDRTEREKNAQDAQTANERLISERFFSAVSLLGDASCSSRIGGIYTLQSIAETSNAFGDYRRRTIRILTAFIKDRCPYPLPQDLAQKSSSETVAATLDIKIALETIHKLWKELPPDNSEILDLNHTSFKDLKLDFMDCWEYIHLEKSHLNCIDFRESNLSTSRFTNSTLINVKFGAAILIGASFREARLKDVEFVGANLEGADFTNATFENVNFENAQNIEKADFKGANLEGAKGLPIDKLNFSLSKKFITIGN